MDMFKNLTDTDLYEAILGFKEVVVFGATNIGWYLYKSIGGGSSKTKLRLQCVIILILCSRT